jgi:hypothetical protein
VDESLVSGSADLTDFPVLVSVTSNDLKSVANGGKVESGSGYDIRFETTGGTKLDHEFESWSATTGALLAWVRIPTLSYNVDTDFYLYIGKSGLGSTEANPTGVWGSQYLGVWHLSDGATLSGADSTSAARNGTLTNTPTAVTGQVDGAAGFVAASSNFITVPAIAALAGASTASLTAWCYRASSSDNLRIGRTNATGGRRFGWGWETGGFWTAVVENGSANYPSFGDSSTGWHHFALTFDGTLGTASARVKAYKDGASKTLSGGGSGNPSTLNATSGLVFDMGRDLDGGARYSTGRLDEVRLYSTTISPDWITTEYNSTVDPATFCAVGTFDPDVSEATGTGSGSASVGGSGTATVAVSAAGSGSFTVAGSGTAVVAIAATGSGGFTAGGSGAATIPITAAGAGSVTVSGSATATVGDPPVDAVGSGGFTVTGSGTATVAVTATGSGSFTVTGSGEAIAGFTPAIATGSGGFTVGGAGTATVLVTATGSGSATVTGSGTATIPVTAAGSGGFTVGGTGEAISGFTPAIATGSGGFTVSGSATATVLVQGNAVGIFVVGGSGLATVPVLAVGAGSFAVAGSGTALATFGVPPSTAFLVTRLSGARTLVERRTAHRTTIERRT